MLVVGDREAAAQLPALRVRGAQIWAPLPGRDCGEAAH